MNDYIDSSTNWLISYQSQDLRCPISSQLEKGCNFYYNRDKHFPMKKFFCQETRDLFYVGSMKNSNKELDM